MAGAPAHTNSTKLTNISPKMQKQSNNKALLLNSSKFFTSMKNIL